MSRSSASRTTTPSCASSTSTRRRALLTPSKKMPVPAAAISNPADVQRVGQSFGDHGDHRPADAQHRNHESWGDARRLDPTHGVVAAALERLTHCVPVDHTECHQQAEAEWTNNHEPEQHAAEE